MELIIGLQLCICLLVSAVILSSFIVKTANKVVDDFYWKLSLVSSATSIVMFGVFIVFQKWVLVGAFQFVLLLSSIFFLAVSLLRVNKVSPFGEAKPISSYLRLIEIAPNKALELNRVLKYSFHLRAKLEGKVSKARLIDLKSLYFNDYPKGIVVLEAFERGVYLRNINEDFQVYNELEGRFPSLEKSIANLFLNTDRVKIEEEFGSFDDEKLKAYFNKLVFTESDRNSFIVLAMEMYKRGFVDEIREKILAV